MSMNWADVYGGPSQMSATLQPTSVVGPTQGSVVPATGKLPPSGVAGAATTGVAFTWVGLILLLIAWRVLAEMAR